MEEIIMLLDLTLFCTIVQVLGQVDFTGHKLYGLFASDEEKLEFLRGLSEDNEIDLWNFPTSLNEKTTVRVAPEAIERLENELKANRIDFYVVHDNIQKLIDEEREENLYDDESSQMPDDYPLNIYHDFKGISAYIDSVAKHYPRLVEVVNIGTTDEQNSIKGLKIGISRANKSAIWIDAGIHGREWMAPATALYVINQLVKGNCRDTEIRQLLNTFDWYIFPVVNPDGYIYTWTHDRTWRKNRSELRTNPLFSDMLSTLMHAINATGTLCRGVDPNRNFNASFGGEGASSHPCTNNYQGVSAFSEAESRAIRDGVQRIGSNLKAYLSLHSFMQAWLAPFGNTTEVPPDHDDQMNALRIVHDAMQDVHGTDFAYGSVSNLIGVIAPGSSIDWAYAHAKVKYSFAVELRYTGGEGLGFIQPRSQIIPTAEECFAGIKALANYISS